MTKHNLPMPSSKECRNLSGLCALIVIIATIGLVITQNQIYGIYAMLALVTHFIMIGFKCVCESIERIK